MDRHGVKRNRLMLRLMVFAAATAAMLVPASSAQAELPTSISASYSGWSFAIGERSFSAYRWTGASWTSTSITPGMSFKTQPWVNGWHLAARNGTWYALKPAQLSPFTCQSTPLARQVVGTGMVEILRYNNKNTRIGIVPMGASVYLICENSFPDATGATQFFACGIPDCGSYGPMEYRLAWVRLNGAWTKAYLRIPQYCNLERCYGPPPAAN